MMDTLKARLDAYKYREPPKWGIGISYHGWMAEKLPQDRVFITEFKSADDALDYIAQQRNMMLAWGLSEADLDLVEYTKPMPICYGRDQKALCKIVEQWWREHPEDEPED